MGSLELRERALDAHILNLVTIVCVLGSRWNVGGVVLIAGFHRFVGPRLHGHVAG